MFGNWFFILYCVATIDFTIFFPLPYGQGKNARDYRGAVE